MSTCQIRRRREDEGAASAALASPAELSADEAASASCTEAACTRPLRALRRTGTLLGSLMSACSSARAGIEAVYTCQHTLRHDTLPCMSGCLHSKDMPGSCRMWYAPRETLPNLLRPTVPQQYSKLSRQMNIETRLKSDAVPAPEMCRQPELCPLPG